MDKKLENLKQEMDEILYKDINFTEKHRADVLNKIFGGVDSKRERNDVFKRLCISVLSFAIPIGALFVLLNNNGIGINSNNERPGHSNAGEASPNLEENSANVDTSVFTPTAKEEVFEEMTKEEVLTKMLNTVDNFQTANGSFEEQVGGQKQVVSYELILNGKNSSGYSLVKNDKGEVFTVYFGEGEIWNINHSSKTYMEGLDLSNGDFGSPITLDTAFGTKTASGESATSYRERPNIGVAVNSLFPYEIASNYTRDLLKWDVEKQDEEVMGHNTLVIKGSLNDFAKGKSQSSTFRFWVDKDTGILIKYETYNDAGDIIDYLHPIEMKINEPINKKEFFPNLDGYTQSN